MTMKMIMANYESNALVNIQDVLYYNRTHYPRLILPVPTTSAYFQKHMLTPLGDDDRIVATPRIFCC